MIVCWVMCSAITTGIFPSATEHDDCLLGDAFGYVHRLVNTIIQGGSETKTAEAGSQAQTTPELAIPQIAALIIIPGVLAGSTWTGSKWDPRWLTLVYVPFKLMRKRTRPLVWRP